MMPPLRLVALVALLAFPSLAQRASAKPFDFRPFAGVYSGTVTFLFADGYPTAIGTAKIVVTSSRLGGSATVAINGKTSFGNRAQRFSNAFTFTSSGKTIEQDLFYERGKNGGAVGKYSGRKRTVRFTLTGSFNGSPAIVVGKMSINPKGRESGLTFDTHVTDSTGTSLAYIFSFDVTQP